MFRQLVFLPSKRVSVLIPTCCKVALSCAPYSSNQLLQRRVAYRWRHNAGSVVDSSILNCAIQDSATVEISLTKVPWWFWMLCFLFTLYRLRTSQYSNSKHSIQQGSDEEAVPQSAEPVVTNPLVPTIKGARIGAIPNHSPYYVEEAQATGLEHQDTEDSWRHQLSLDTSRMVISASRMQATDVLL